MYFNSYSAHSKIRRHSLKNYEGVYLRNHITRDCPKQPRSSTIECPLAPSLAMATIPTSTAEAKDLVQKLRSEPDNVDLHQVVRGACTAESWLYMSEAGYVEFFIEYMGSYEHGDMRSVRVSSLIPGSNVRAVTDSLLIDFASMINRIIPSSSNICRMDFQHGVYQHGASLSLFKPPTLAPHPSVNTRSTFAPFRIYAQK
jgi:hypothetical protein